MENFFRKNLEFLKHKRGETYASIGLQADVSANTVSYWLNKNFEPKMIEVVKLSQYFEIPINDLLFTDLSNTDLTENRSVEKKPTNTNLNTGANTDLTTQNPLTLAHRQQAEVPPLWAIGMLQKLEAMAADIEALKKDDDNSESRVGAA